MIDLLGLKVSRSLSDSEDYGLVGPLGSEIVFLRLDVEYLANFIMLAKRRFMDIKLA